ncbi:MAG: phytanoyl-CoA dioxygenase family protein [Pseudomonadota bacterium]
MEFTRENEPDEMRAFFEEFGYLVLRGFFSQAHVERVNAEIRFALSTGRTCFPDTTVDVLAPSEYQAPLSEIDAQDLEHPIKINDIYQTSDMVLRTCRERDLIRILSMLLEGTPIVINTLNLIHGSQQSLHNDSWFMPPPSQGRMVAASICLDDITEENGPVFYLPGSHKLSPVCFDGGRRAVRGASEIKAVRTDVEKRAGGGKFEHRQFTAEAGDVLIWHGELLHGGAPIRDKCQTRRTLVTHYWCAQDVRDGKLAFENGEPLYLIKRKGIGRLIAKFPALGRTLHRLSVRKAAH